MKTHLISSILAVMVIVGIARGVDAQTTAPATQPVSADPSVPAVKTGRGAPTFLEMHEQFLKRAKEGNIDLLFLGDSITAGWTKAPDIWEKLYAPRNAANFGIGGDRTQHVLWRITNGELEGIRPKVVVLMIGTNNTNSDAAEPIAAAVAKIVTITREKTGAKVLLLGVFPRERRSDVNNQTEKIKTINQIISKLDDGKNVRYLDLTAKYMKDESKLNQALFSDGLHPNPQGYQVWAETMQPLLEEMMK